MRKQSEKAPAPFFNIGCLFSPCHLPDPLSGDLCHPDTDQRQK